MTITPTFFMTVVTAVILPFRGSGVAGLAPFLPHNKCLNHPSSGVFFSGVFTFSGVLVLHLVVSVAGSFPLEFGGFLLVLPVTSVMQL